MTMQQATALRAFVASHPDVDCRENVPLSGLCTLHIGGKGDFLLTPSNQSAFVAAVRFLKTENIRFFVLGKGSNLLFSDRGFRGVILSCAGLNQMRSGGNEINAESGVSVTALARFAAEQSLAGMEFYYGIPGSVGGAIYMNAGAYDGETAGILKEVRCLDLETDVVMTLCASECDLSYRHSRFQDKRHLILSATFVLTPGEEGAIRAQMEDLMARRIAKQPLNYPSAGSTFKRYPGRFTAQMIDEAGLKGVSVGGAQVSEKHAGFLINRGNATEKDFSELIALVKERVFAVHGVKIECEVERVEE